MWVLIKPLGEDSTLGKTPGTVKPFQVSLVEPVAYQFQLRQYFAAGVKEVWIVDPEARTAEIWIGPSLPERDLTAADAITSPLLPAFSLSLEELFS